METIVATWLALLALWCVWQVIRLACSGVAAAGEAMRQAVAKRKASAEAATAAERTRYDEARKAADTKVRQDERFRVIGFHRQHYPELAARWPEEFFKDHVNRWLGDDVPIGLVRQRGEELFHQLVETLALVQVHRQSGSRHARADSRGTVQDYYTDNEQWLANAFPPHLFRAELERRIPETADAEAAWKGAQELLRELYAIVEPHKKQQEQRQSQRKELEQQLKQLEDQLAAFDLTSLDDLLLRRRRDSLERRRQELRSQLQQLF